MLGGPLPCALGLLRLMAGMGWAGCWWPVDGGLLNLGPDPPLGWNSEPREGVPEIENELVKSKNSESCFEIWSYEAVNGLSRMRSTNLSCPCCQDIR